MSRIQLKSIRRDSNCSTGPALNPMACVDNLAKLYFRIAFNNKEIFAVLAQNHTRATHEEKIYFCRDEIKVPMSTSNMSVQVLLLNRRSFPHNLFSVLTLITTLWFCAKTARISLLLNPILKYNFTKLSTQAIGSVQALWSGCYPSQLISTVFSKFRV